MTLRRNILANYLSQGYVTAINIAVVPLYLRWLGAEAYGLIGFFAVLQVTFNILDLGLTSTLVRETARFRAGSSSAINYRRLVRGLQVIFLIIALVGGSLAFMAAGFLAGHWLNANLIPHPEVVFSLEMMAVTAAMRWLAGVNRSAISGAEEQVWLGIYTSFIATIRFPGALLALIFIDATPRIFFTFQVIVSTVELIGLVVKSRSLLPRIPSGESIGWSLKPVLPVLKFSLGVAFTASVWVAVTQTDKLVLSRFLPLSEYGYFTLAALVASSVTLVTAPISIALIPRLVSLEAQGDREGFAKIYEKATHLVAVIALPAAFTLAVFAEPALASWTGDSVAAARAAPILRLYAIGNAILAIGAFPFYLQYAKGKLRLHMIGSGLYLIFLVPSIIFATIHFGAIGAGWTWLLANLIYLCSWAPLVHFRLQPGLHHTWFFKGIIPIGASAAFASLAASFITVPDAGRAFTLVTIGLMGLGIMSASLLGSSIARQRARLILRKVANV